MHNFACRMVRKKVTSYQFSHASLLAWDSCYYMKLPSATVVEAVVAHFKH